MSCRTALRVLAPLLCVLLGLTACGKETPPRAPAAAPAPKPQPVSYGVAPDFELVDQEGKPFSSETLRGQVWLATFFFTRCLGTCPVQSARLAELQGRLAEHPSRGDIHLLSISVDPEHDRPAVLRAYAAKHAAQTDQWHFLTGERRPIWLLSTEGFRLPAGPDPTNEKMPIGHSAKYAVMDRRGRVRGLVESQDEDAVDTVLALLTELAAEAAPARLGVPEAIFDTAWLDERAEAQRAEAGDWTVEHGFRFHDARRASGIRFRHRMVDDGGKTYKAVHYDHGSGVAAADVDGDGRLDLYFSNQVGSNRLYRNLGGGRFEDVTKHAGVAVADAIGVSASFADTDNDGDPDLYVTTVGGTRFFINDGKGVFSDATAASGLGYAGHPSASVFFDYDRDGKLDVLLCNVGAYTTAQSRTVIDDSTTAGSERGTFTYREGMRDGFSGHLKPERDEPSLLFRNLGGNRFKNVTTDVLLHDAGWCGSATPIDLNDDGWLDLYLTNMQGHDACFLNRDGVMFERRSRDLFPKTPWGSMGVKVLDQDGDGRLDLFITDMHSDMSQRVPWQEEKKKSEMLWSEKILRSEGKSIWGNALFRKQADGSYREVSDAVGAETYWPWGLSVGDVNADGRPDAFVTGGMSYPYRYGINSLLLGSPGGFRDAEFVVGVEPRAGPHVLPWFDLDCSGADREHKDAKDCDGPAIVWAPPSSRSSVLLDLDGDGDLDIVTNDFNGPPLVLRNDLADTKGVRWIGIRLEGTAANRDGLGAVVRVHAGGRVQVQAHDGQSGYISQSSMPLYFGLGDAQAVERVEITWPGGDTQVVAKPAPNRIHVMRQP